MKSFTEIGAALGISGKQAFGAYRSGIASLRRRILLPPELLAELENDLAAEALKKEKENRNVTSLPDLALLGDVDFDLRGALHVSPAGGALSGARDANSLPTAPGSVFRQCA